MVSTTADGTQAIEAFLAGAEVVAAAVASPEVATCWEQPSVLEEQTVGSLAGHLARGAVWAVADYLDAGEPEGELTYRSAGEYFAHRMSIATSEDHEAIRRRGADVGSVGQAALAEELRRRLDALQRELPTLPPARRVTVVGGSIMRLDDYLRTRIVEQVVHLDDLARSVGREWPVPDACTRVAIDAGLEVAERRLGTTAVLRALYRRGFSDVLPVF